MRGVVGGEREVRACCGARRTFPEWPAFRQEPKVPLNRNTFIPHEPSPSSSLWCSVGVEVGVEVGGRAGLRLGSGLGTEVEIEIGVGVGGRGPSWGWGEVQGSSECAHRQGLQPRGICLREGGSGLLWWVLK